MNSRRFEIAFVLSAFFLNLICVSSAFSEPSNATGGEPPVATGGEERAQATPARGGIGTGEDLPEDTAAEKRDDSDSVEVNDDEAGNMASGETPSSSEVLASERPEHRRLVAPFPKDHRIRVELVTTAGNISCDLYADTHPLTTLNFVALATGSPAWQDASGAMHSTPYYEDLAFDERKRGAYVVSGERTEGTGFYVVDERCSVHPPVAGAIAMVQSHPGTASSKFILLARDIVEFSGLYAVFGQCDDIDVIERLTKKKAVLERVVVK